MKTKQRVTGTASSIPGGLAWGALSAMSLTLAGAAVTALLIKNETLAWKNTGYSVLFILLLSSWLGATVTKARVKRQRLVMCMASGVVYFSILMATTALFFGGQYSGVGETTLLILCGSVMAILTDHSRKHRSKSKNNHSFNR